MDSFFKFQIVKSKCTYLLKRKNIIMLSVLLFSLHEQRERKITYDYKEGLPGDWANKETWSFISREQGDTFGKRKVDGHK